MHAAPIINTAGIVLCLKTLGMRLKSSVSGAIDSGVTMSQTKLYKATPAPLTMSLSHTKSALIVGEEVSTVVKDGTWAKYIHAALGLFFNN